MIPVCHEVSERESTIGQSAVIFYKRNNDLGSDLFLGRASNTSSVDGDGSGSGGGSGGGGDGGGGDDGGRKGMNLKDGAKGRVGLR
ncbi:hypothetical protein HZH66_003132 [Vespula vulgaris]|uniref:Uncharacterized protein n=1 Tax=Vespula vulgaris TaxID=7454 RepID=A0A834KL22_VESVU|nr:hypothetical protein HZH66_003132 [Vespula vulgaris]